VGWRQLSLDKTQWPVLVKLESNLVCLSKIGEQLLCPWKWDKFLRVEWFQKYLVTCSLPSNRKGRFYFLLATNSVSTFEVFWDVRLCRMVHLPNLCLHPRGRVGNIYPWRWRNFMMISALFWGITQHIVVISYWRFGTTYRSLIQGSRNPSLISWLLKMD
jgi:hypothetical protein